MSQLLKDGKKSRWFDVVSMGCRDCFPYRRGGAFEQLGIDGAQSLAEDDKVPETANGVGFLRRVDSELYDFVALGEYAVEYLKYMGIAQVLKKFVSVQQGLGMFDGSAFQTLPQLRPRITGR
jgi:hypothetical protein